MGYGEEFEKQLRERIQYVIDDRRKYNKTEKNICRKQWILDIRTAEVITKLGINLIRRSRYIHQNLIDARTGKTILTYWY